MHAVQTGVMYMMENGSKEAEPKQLRVGINSAMVSDAAIVKLLVDKGLITMDEFYKELADAAEKEAKLYTEALEQVYGVKVTLL